MVRLFWSRLFLYFSEWNFGLEFDDPRGVWKIRGITPEIFWGLANSSRLGNNEPKLQFLKICQSGIHKK
jgi:hypothetical protein